MVIVCHIVVPVVAVARAVRSPATATNKMAIQVVAANDVETKRRLDRASLAKVS